MSKEVKVVAWVADGYPIVSLYEPSVKDQDIRDNMEKEFGEVPPDLEITTEYVNTRPVV